MSYNQKNFKVRHIDAFEYKTHIIIFSWKSHGFYDWILQNLNLLSQSEKYAFVKLQILIYSLYPIENHFNMRSDQMQFMIFKISLQTQKISFIESNCVRWMGFKSRSQDWKPLKPLIEPKTTDLAHLAVKQLSS